MLVIDQFKKGDRPLWFLTVGILGGMGILLTGLWYLQVVRTQRYVDSQKTQAIRKVRFPALRGNIVDRNGVILAENRPSYNVNLYIEELSARFQDAFHRARANRKLNRAHREALAKTTRFLVVSNIVQQLGAIIQQPLQIDESRFLRHYTNRLALPLTLLTNLSPVQIAMFLEQPNKPPGLNLDIQPLRYYPNGTLAAHIVGQLQRTEKLEDEDEIEFDYCLPDFEGKVGIEGGFDRDLRGVAGVKAVTVNNLGYRQAETNWSASEPGKNLFLTIDLRIQKAAEQALATVGPSVKGAVVVMDPNNGDLLALASAPTFDPNWFIPSISHELFEKVNDDDLKPTWNRATHATYSPGSIFKIVISLAGLEAGTLDPKETFHSLGYFKLTPKSRPIGDTAKAGDFDFTKAFIKSSNPYFITNGLKAGLTNIMEMGKRFCLGQEVRLPLLQDAKGFFPTPEWVRQKKERGEPVTASDVCQLSIGQGYVQVTPVQMAIMTAAVANGGKVFWPRLVDRLESRESNDRIAVQKYPTGQLRSELGIQPKNMQILREAMLADVDQAGTGSKAAVEGMDICGKTGTAQVKHGEVVVRWDTWFVSFAPINNPRYAIVVFVEGGGSGSGTCAPVAHKIYQAIKKLENDPQSLHPTLAKADSDHRQP